ncbi:hypothetical protein E2R55_21600 [Vibrio vulnificus]|nr:hypothetical protein E2R55_21600 [Vibrio vulnificus]
MHKFIKRTTIEDIILILFIAIFAIVFLGLLNYSQNKNELDLLSNDLYSKDSIKFYLDNNKPINLEGFETKYEFDINYIIFKENIDNNINAIYVNGENTAIPIKSGRFFQKSDFYKGKHVALIGRDFRDVESIGNKRYIQYGPEKFEVIGVLGGSIKSKIDNKAFINIDAVYKLGQKYNNGAYILDGHNKTKQIFESLEAFHKDDAEFKKIEADGKGLSRLVTVKNNHLLIILSLVILSVNLMVLSFWLYKKRVLIAVYQLIGHPAWIIFSLNVVKFIFISFISLLIGMSAFFLISGHFMDFNAANLRLASYTLVIFYLYNFIIFLISTNAFSIKKCIKVLK